ncbi:unnamed protein product [Angiostrongylus costaricensis]|uniref:Protein-tyrosine phosphatase n=1 Tax=Angiostrongylus costaricensis TaxID=334426 RepID=A0A158PK30_ANGCS|nr:unnamed protein product [Angiostrongylus costaricensis]
MVIPLATNAVQTGIGSDQLQGDRKANTPQKNDGSKQDSVATDKSLRGKIIEVHKSKETTDDNTDCKKDASKSAENVTSASLNSQCDNLSAQQFQREFERLPEPDMRMCKTWLEPQNLRKNRYNNIPCIDSTRVLITFCRQEVGAGYIHANRIEYPTLRNKYIVTQGPLPETVNTFWQMIWQENVVCIVMLCKTIEDGKRKCAEYFSPNFNVLTKYGQLNVVLKNRKWEDEVITSMLEVNYLHESRTITHHQWENWSDFKVQNVVHCSAGVGRSGTFMALEMCLQDLANGIPVNVFQVVVHLRKYRALAVQTFDQYLSIYRTILQMGEKHGTINKVSFYIPLLRTTYVIGSTKLKW